MSRIRELERHFDGARERVRDYAESASDAAGELAERGRRAARRFGHGGDYRRRLVRLAEDMADEANYQYRRARRHVQRHPVATAAIVAGTVGAFLLLRRLFRDDEE
ncbi:hypothetical protein [Fulvimonas soli]|uniref:ElaB/YqjD/DUF883 family membrane-anchored ribosome-binding protein n=1 Tax=Fulvimonas soli TaxID=155197 RepID=A0A316I0V4_9GAMM|nr:hypothetical protein [Fulvimonas soli]PWK85922.1 hypothetical protein C7456_108218 [Fulvimonas soli]TNY26987.1 hypothetical protein BV497_05865 [Fulvimonas soli]